MINRESVTKKEIEAKLANSGDYVKMDYLQRCLKMQMDFDTKKFVLVKLAAIYEVRKMYLEAARMMRNAADINATLDSKFNDFLKTLELFIKAGNYEEVEITYKKALGIGNTKQKVSLKMKMKELYRTQAKELLGRDKRKHALEMYKKLLEFDLDSTERKEVQNVIMHLYEKLGRVREYYDTQRSMNNPVPIKTKREEAIEKEERLEKEGRMERPRNARFDSDLGIEFY